MNKEMKKELDRKFCESFLRGVYNFAAETPVPTAETKDSDGSGEGSEGTAPNPSAEGSAAPTGEPSTALPPSTTDSSAAPDNNGDSKNKEQEEVEQGNPESENPAPAQPVTSTIPQMPVGEELEKGLAKHKEELAKATTDEERRKINNKYAHYLSANEARNTALNLTTRMAPGKNETWSQAWNRLTPEQKWGVGIGGGVSSLLALQMLTKKKKDLSDYLMAGVFPLAGVAAGAFGGSALTANPNTFDENVYREAYQRLTQPQTSTGTPA